MDPSLYKKLETTRGYTYRYIRVAAASTKPTFLFIHGFPSTSYDWHHQVKYFSDKGYGLVVPDMLGYGGTDKPADLAAFRLTAMAQDLIEILDAEHVENVVAVGHDWGSMLVSRLSSIRPDRFLGFGFLALGYAPGGVVSDMEVVRKLLQVDPKPPYGYILYFLQEGAAHTIEQNMDSFLEILYPKDPTLWSTDIAPPGKTQEWIEQNKRTDRADYLTEEDYAIMRKTLLEGGMTAPLNWYKVHSTAHNDEDNRMIPQENVVMHKPVFFGAALKDYVCLAEHGKRNMSEYAEGGATIVDFDAGHWVQLEQPEKLNSELEDWVNGLQ